MADDNKKDEEAPDAEKEEVAGEEVPADPKKETEGGDTGGNDAGGNESGGWWGCGRDSMVDIDEKHQVAMAGTFLSGAILLVSVLTVGDPDKGSGYWAYGIALSVCTMFLAFVGWGMDQKPQLVEGHPQVSRHLIHFLVVWNFVGACFMTFGDGPFNFTGNGYFSAWGMAIFSIKALSHANDFMANVGSMMGHLAASLVVIVAIAADWSTTGELIYGIIVACLSAIVVMFEHRSVRNGSSFLGDYKWHVLLVLALAWVVSACILTFRGPFTQTGNGYFGAWGAVVTGLYAFMGVHTQA